jgi:integrase
VEERELGSTELVIEAVKSKTRTARIVPISTRLLAILEMRRTDPDGKELGPDAFVFGNEVGEQVKSVRVAWERARGAAGLTRLQLRDLRHEAGSRFDEAGVPTNYVSKLLGHTNLTTTSRYSTSTGGGFRWRCRSSNSTRPSRRSLHNRCTRPRKLHQPLCLTRTIRPPANRFLPNS